MPTIIVKVASAVNPEADAWLDQNLFSGVRISVKVAVLWALSTPAQFGVGWRFYRMAYRGAMHCSFGMDFLVVLGLVFCFLFFVLLGGRFA